MAIFKLLLKRFWKITKHSPPGAVKEHPKLKKSKHPWHCRPSSPAPAGLYVERVVDRTVRVWATFAGRDDQQCVRFGKCAKFGFRERSAIIFSSVKYRHSLDGVNRRNVFGQAGYQFSR
ncbi:hypothetical protein B0G62_106176 [Paraburkholderia eburnea]|uniref:Uncharacterized protein n=1 Tax=Paraburkholderia eburnea TaxID=1189126 RepID=A0A2S4MA74_9BURK|nr:hypothetical protein B0G62_106176 [Paraburkholderia eburnea]PRZ22673.1 hypothetical protein BX588_106176 [Paraburkholderia eburnea]